MNRLSGCIRKFLSGERLTKDEFSLLSKVLNDLYHQPHLFVWLEENWQQSQDETVLLEFEQIRRKVRSLSLKSGANRLLRFFSRAAAILFVPLAVLLIYLSRQEYTGLLTLSTQKGEQTGLTLPDGSKVWLNVDTKLRYPLDYGVKSRSVELEGEAYFEVAENEALPFEVTSGAVTTQALGTRFVISAYPEQAKIKSSLIQGAIEISCGQAHTTVKEGQQWVYHKGSSSADILPFDENYELAWKNDQLRFWLTPFAEVINKLGKWYDIEIEYEPEFFESETLTVRFEPYETLEHVLQVMAKAHDFSYSVKDKKIILTK
jgi:ferric-dicitrate binding protein FerR (iron transport regulator)